MGIKEAQDRVREFDVARGWENSWNVKDFLDGDFIEPA